MCAAACHLVTNTGHTQKNGAVLIGNTIKTAPFVNTGHTQKNGAVFILETIKNAPFVWVWPG
jgi:hypothetical protein